MARTALGLVAALVAAACTGTAATTTSRPVPAATASSETSTAVPTTAAATASCRDHLAGGERADEVLAVHDLPSGAVRWEAGIGLPDAPFPVPFAVAGELVVIKEGDTLWALDAATCDVRWELPGRQVLAVAGGDGLVAVVDSIALRVLDATSGEQRWSFGMRWEPPELPAGVAFAPGLVVVSTPDDELVMLDATAGDEVGRAAFGEHLREPQVVGDDVYVTHGSTVESLALANTGQEWATDVGFAIYPDLGLGEGAVFVVSSADATVAALDAATGEERWRRTVDPLLKFEAPPLVDHGEVHLVDTDRRLHHLDAADGSTVFVGRGDAARARLAPGPGLLLEEGGGFVTGFTLLERRAWALETGAGDQRVSLLQFGDGFVAVLSFDWS